MLPTPPAISSSLSRRDSLHSNAASICVLTLAAECRAAAHHCDSCCCSSSSPRPNPGPNAAPIISFFITASSSSARKLGPLSPSCVDGWMAAASSSCSCCLAAAMPIAPACRPPPVALLHRIAFVASPCPARVRLRHWPRAPGAARSGSGHMPLAERTCGPSAAARRRPRRRRGAVAVARVLSGLDVPRPAPAAVRLVARPLHGLPAGGPPRGRPPRRLRGSSADGAARSARSAVAPTFPHIQRGLKSGLGGCAFRHNSRTKGRPWHVAARSQSWAPGFYSFTHHPPQ